MKTLRIFGGGAVNGLVDSLRPSFEAETGCTFDGTYSAVGAMNARVVAGEPVDVVILTRALIDRLAKDGHVIGASAADLGRVETAVAVRQSDAPPSVATADGLRAALLAADEIHVPDTEQSTAGIHIAKVLRQLGIWEAVAARLKTAPNGATAMRALAQSKSARAIGSTQATEILSTQGLTLVGSLPPGCDLATAYVAAVGTHSRVPADAARLVALLGAPAGRDARRQLGFV